jgi:hypothetical protein
MLMPGTCIVLGIAVVYLGPASWDFEIKSYTTYTFLQNIDYQCITVVLFENNLQNRTILVHSSLKEALLPTKRASFGHQRSLFH